MTSTDNLQALWQPTASMAMLKKRAELFHDIRKFFADRNVIEVDTPYLSRSSVADPFIAPIESKVLDQQAFLHTSPEYPMKRLLCAGSGDIYFMGKVFRDGEAGGKHNPEFTMLEWYRVGWDHWALIDEVIAFLTLLLGDKSVTKRRYKDIFKTEFNLDVLEASFDEVKAKGVDVAGQDLDLDRGGWLDYLMSHHIEPSFDPNLFTVVTDFPAEQAALAKVTKDSEGQWVAQRFEVYVAGVELANGYCELTDAIEQEKRFQNDQRVRFETFGQDYPIDQKLITAMASENGLPNCAGVALGVDRLLMIQQGVANIQAVLPFAWHAS